MQIDVEALKAKLLIQLSNGEKVGVFDFHRAGGKFAYLDKNRSIDMKHVEFLFGSFKRVGMLNSIKVVAARKLIEEGHILRDRTGNMLTLATPNIDMYYCILDGQHKADALALWLASEETRNIPLDARMELVNIPKGFSIEHILENTILPVRNGIIVIPKHFWYRPLKKRAGLFFPV